MRPVPVVLAALLLAPSASALIATGCGCEGSVVTGKGYGAGAVGASAGVWELVHVYVQGAPVVGSATLQWSRTLLQEQFDITIWKPGADDDGQLTSDEILYASWGDTVAPHRTISFTLPPAGEPYVFTVEPTNAPEGAPWALASNAVWFHDDGITVGTKLDGLA